MPSPAARFGRLRSSAACTTALALALATLPVLAATAPVLIPTLAQAASPEGQDFSAAILPLVVEGEMPEGDRETLTSQLVDGIRRGNFTVVTPAEVEAAGEGSCAKPGCMKDIAKKTGASYIVRATVEVVDRDYTVAVELYDASGATIVTSSDGCEICGVADVGNLLATQAATLRTKLEALATGPASISITSTPAGAEVTLDGEPYGVTPLDKPIIPGDHTIRVSLEGYISVQEKRTFVEGARETLSYDLDKVPNRLPKRPWGWAALGVGIASLGGSIGTAVAIHGRLPYRLSGACNEADRDKYDGQDCVFLWDTMALSLPLGIVGGALTTLGVAILITTAKNPRKKAKIEAATSRLRVGPGGLGVRF